MNELILFINADHARPPEPQGAPLRCLADRRRGRGRAHHAHDVAQHPPHLRHGPPPAPRLASTTGRSTTRVSPPTSARAGRGLEAPEDRRAPRQGDGATVALLFHGVTPTQARSPVCAGPTSTSATATTSWSPSAARSLTQPAPPLSAASTPRRRPSPPIRSSVSASTRSTAASLTPAPRPASRAAEPRQTAARGSSRSNSPRAGHPRMPSSSPAAGGRRDGRALRLERSPSRTAPSPGSSGSGG